MSVGFTVMGFLVYSVSLYVGLSVAWWVDHCKHNNSLAWSVEHCKCCKCTSNIRKDLQAINVNNNIQAQ